MLIPPRRALHDPQELFGVRTKEWLLPQVQQPAGVAGGSSDANVSARDARVAARPCIRPR